MCCVQRHQVKYSFGLGGFQAEHPPPYTTCVQQLPGGAWLLPSVGGGLALRPPHQLMPRRAGLVAAHAQQQSIRVADGLGNSAVSCCARPDDSVHVACKPGAEDCTAIGLCPCRRTQKTILRLPL